MVSFAKDVIVRSVRVVPRIKPLERPFIPQIVRAGMPVSTK